MIKVHLFLFVILPSFLFGQNNHSDTLKNDLAKIQTYFNSINSILPRGIILFDSTYNNLYISLYTKKFDDSIKQIVFYETYTEIVTQPIDTLSLKKYCKESNINYNHFFELIKLTKKYRFKQISFAGPGDLLACSIFIVINSSTGYILYNRSHYCRKKNCYWRTEDETLKKIFKNVYYITWKPKY